MKKVIALFNKFLAKFKPQVTPVQEKEYSYPELCVKFWNENPAFVQNSYAPSNYVGDINYVKDNEGKIYFKVHNSPNDEWFCDYDYKKPSKAVLEHMIEETTFSTNELKEKFNHEQEVRSKTTDTGRNDGDCR